MSYVVRFHSKDFLLSGIHRFPGDLALGFKLTYSDGETTLDPLASTGRKLVLLSVPSLDTPVCDEEAKTFSARAGEMKDATVVVISADLPFAQSRWLKENGITNLVVGSDHRRMIFGNTYGTLIEELRILTRAAFVVNVAGKIKYAKYMVELNEQVDFEEIIEAVKNA